MDNDNREPDREDDRRCKRAFRRKSVGSLGTYDKHPAVDIASCLTIALERVTQRAERAESEVLALLGDAAKPAAKDEVECSICFEKLPTDRRKRMRYENEGIQLLQCRHLFHRGCIESYLKAKQGQTAPCPVCRALDAAQYRSLDSVRGSRLPIPTSDQQVDLHPVWYSCLGEKRSDVFTRASLTLMLNRLFSPEMREQRQIPSAMDMTREILNGFADEEDI